jgi:hypothetical protein
MTCERGAPRGEAALITMRIHPVLACFPEHTEDELFDLTESIKEIGLLMPIIVAEIDSEDVLIEGRARLKACATAGIEIRRISLAPGEDPAARVRSANLCRQQLTPSQRAMAIALAYPEPGTGPTCCPATQAAVELAREFVRADRMLARLVIKGAYSLHRTLAKVRQRVWDDAWHDAQMERLRREAIGLNYEVREERMDLAEAVALLDRRQEGNVWDASDRPIEGVWPFVGAGEFPNNEEEDPNERR